MAVALHVDFETWEDEELPQELVDYVFRRILEASIALQGERIQRIVRARARPAREVAPQARTAAADARPALEDA